MHGEHERSSGIFPLGFFRRFGRFEEEALERGPRPAALDQARAGFRREVLDFVYQRGRSVFENELGLVLDRKQIVERTFPHEHAIRENADAVENSLPLLEEMRREQDRDAAPLEVENEIADLARAHWIHSGGRFIEDKEFRFLDQRLR